MSLAIAKAKGWSITSMMTSPTQSPNYSPDYAPLASMLRHRLEVIADHDWRDRDSGGHFDALKAVSEAIAAWEAAQPRPVPARLGHFLQQCSYGKALEWIDASTAPANA